MKADTQFTRPDHFEFLFLTESPCLDSGSLGGLCHYGSLKGTNLCLPSLRLLMVRLPSGYKTDIRAGTCEAFMRYGNTKEGKNSQLVFTECTVFASECGLRIYCKSHICDYVHILMKSNLQLFTCMYIFWQDVVGTESPHMHSSRMFHFNPHLRLFFKLRRSTRILCAGSSVGIATCYVLDGPGIESRWEARFSAPVQTGPGAHPASCTVGTGSFPGIERGRGVTLTPTPSSAEVQKTE
jgi:hypothetical protein